MNTSFLRLPQNGGTQKGVSLILFLAFCFAKSITRPIVRLTGVANNIADDNFGEQAEESDKDEIGLLAAAFNKMTRKLIKTRKALKKTLMTCGQPTNSFRPEKNDIGKYIMPPATLFLYMMPTQGKFLMSIKGCLKCMVIAMRKHS
jgi:HAMP domain-containing protein